ncbi:MAG TPA: hypothetical protein VFE04_06930, partial [Puia sp.]|nr:hypothetical protein [Puia sp.]
QRLSRKGLEIELDNNWIITQVTIKGGKFSGQFDAEFLTIDFERFKQELRPLYEDLKGSATFSGIEGYLELKVIGDGLGHFDVAVTACDQPGIGGKLTFIMAFDQTYLTDLISQLDRITKHFPIIGNFNIKNE